MAVTKKYLYATQWHIYEVRHSSVVTALTTLPSVMSGINSRIEWLKINEGWWLNQQRSTTLFASDGPSSWPRSDLANLLGQLEMDSSRVLDSSFSSNGLVFDVRKVGQPIYFHSASTPSWKVNGALGPTPFGHHLYKLVPTKTHVDVVLAQVRLPKNSISRIRQYDQSISFHVSRLGVPVLVKISYFNRWHAVGATGPFRVSPNLMVVIPTLHDVKLVYGSSPAVWWGNLVTDITVFGLLIAVWRRRRWRRPNTFTSSAKY